MSSGISWAVELAVESEVLNCCRRVLIEQLTMKGLVASPNISAGEQPSCMMCMQCDGGSNLSKQRTVDGALPAVGSLTSAKQPTLPFRMHEDILATEYSCKSPLDEALPLTALSKHHCMLAETEYLARKWAGDRSLLSHTKIFCGRPRFDIISQWNITSQVTKARVLVLIQLQKVILEFDARVHSFKSKPKTSHTWIFGPSERGWRDDVAYNDIELPWMAIISVPFEIAESPSGLRTREMKSWEDFLKNTVTFLSRQRTRRCSDKEMPLLTLVSN